MKEERSPTSSSSSSTLLSESRETTAARPMLSTERRDELLQMARAKRIAWVEGTTGGLGRRRRGSDSSKQQSSTMPSHVMELMKCADDMLHFVESFDVVATHPPLASDARKDSSSNDSPISILQEIVASNEHLPSSNDPSDLPPLRLDPTFQRAYNQLLDVLKHPDAADLVHSIQGFVKSFHETASSSSRTASTSSRGDKVHAFISHFLHLMQLSPLIKTLEASSPDALSDLRDHDMRRETLEAFVMEKLHGAAFGACPQEDAALSQRIASLGFLSFEHLDITATSDVARWTCIQARLSQLPRFLSPRRQMACILQVCHDLTHLLKDHLGGKYPGADDFLPALIYTILKANPPNLHSTVAYIQMYRHPSKLMSEPGYFFTHVVSSLSFLEHLDDSGLSISPEEFHLGLQQVSMEGDMQPQAAVDVQGGATSSTSSSSTDNSAALKDKQDGNMGSVLDVWHRRARKKSSTAMQVPLFTFHLPPVMMPPAAAALTTTNSFVDMAPDDLRVQDVPHLLAEYKLLNVLCHQHGSVRSSQHNNNMAM
ncbi:hypothetical protein DYB28_005957 [Aphanomyces astaci]|uniref:VPS9 domain-containing protein n=1 Tax=Aphanomyces astaci TaxID=112090 RepID=A0A9X8DKW7_APHAT|nr:hypothetical protein DYB28_005957 [Aphanomyces astaci]